MNHGKTKCHNKSLRKGQAKVFFIYISDKNVYPNLTSRPSNIQLWQFVKELLNNPNFSYGKGKPL